MMFNSDLSVRGISRMPAATLPHRLAVAGGFLGAILSASPALAAMHSYKLPKVAATLEQCQQVEEWAVERFSRLAEAAVLSHGCERNPSRTYDLVIDYEKAIEAPLVSTYDEYNLVHGLYATVESCQENIESDLVTFREATGIEPLIGYCFKDRPSDSIDQWELRIDGFGSPRLAPQHIAADFFDTIHGPVEQIAATLEQQLAESGAFAPKAKITADADRSAIYVLYYARQRLPIVTYSDAKFLNMEACENQRAAMSDIFSKAGGNTLVYLCGSNRYTSRISLYSSGIVTQPLATELTSVNYESFSACEEKRAATEATWRNRANKNVVGSLCAIEDNLIREFVRMRMFWLD